MNKGARFRGTRTNGGVDPGWGVASRRMRPALGFTRLLAVALLLAAGPVAGVGSVAVAGQIPEGVEGTFAPNREAERAISRLLSPFCPGLMLEVCPSPPAAALRDSIQVLAAEGMKADELVEWMLANHGENYRAIPETRGAGLWAWVMPPFFILLGAGLILVVLRRLRRGRPEAAAPRKGVSDEERARIDAALREMDLGEGAS